MRVHVRSRQFYVRTLIYFSKNILAKRSMINFKKNMLLDMKKEKDYYTLSLK